MFAVLGPPLQEVKVTCWYTILERSDPFFRHVYDKKDRSEGEMRVVGTHAQNEVDIFF